MVQINQTQAIFDANETIFDGNSEAGHSSTNCYSLVAYSSGCSSARPCSVIEQRSTPTQR